MDFIGGSESFRYFKIISVNNKKVKDEGRYKTKASPGDAAKKAFTQLSKKYKTNKLTFSIKETTQGSSKREHGPYLGEKVKLKKPLEVKYKGKNKPVIIKYETKIHLVKDHKQKGGNKVRLYGYLRNKDIRHTHSDLYQKIANLINEDVINKTNDIDKMISRYTNKFFVSPGQPRALNNVNNIEPKTQLLETGPAQVVDASPFIPSLNNLEDENLEKHLLGKLNLRSLMKSRTSRQRKQTVNAMLQNDNTLKKIFLETAKNDPEYIIRLYAKSLPGKIPFLSNPQNHERFRRVMKEVMDNEGIILPEPIERWIEWCAMRPFPELSYMIGGVGGKRDCSGDRGCGGEENGHIFTFYNIQVGKWYHFEASNYEGGRILRSEDIQLTQITYESNSEMFTINLHFGHRIICFQYYLPEAYMVSEGGERPGWSARTSGFSPPHFNVFKPL